MLDLRVVEMGTDCYPSVSYSLFEAFKITCFVVNSYSYKCCLATVPVGSCERGPKLPVINCSNHNLRGLWDTILLSRAILMNFGSAKTVLYNGKCECI